MLQEARARMVDVETGHETGPMRALAEESQEPPASPVRSGRGVKRPRSKPAPAAPEQPLHPVPEPAPSHNASPEPSGPMFGTDELLWLGDPSTDSVVEPGDGSAENAPWRRGLRG
jgi:hypothetical protein